MAKTAELLPSSSGGWKVEEGERGRRGREGIISGCPLGEQLSLSLL